MKVGDKVVMKKEVCPKTRFRMGMVVEIGELWTNSIRIKRDNYKGHEFTWWNKDDWRVVATRRFY